VPAASALREHGAVKVMAYCNAPGAVGPCGGANQRLVLDESWSPTPSRSPTRRRSAEDPAAVLRALLAETISRISREDSVSSLFIE